MPEMPDMKTFTVKGPEGNVTYEIVDGSARERIGSLEELTTEDREKFVSAINEVSAQVSAVAETGVTERGKLASAINGVSAHLSAVEETGVIVNTATGSAIALNDASNLKFKGLTLYGKTTQNGTPTPKNPVELVSVENPVVTVFGKNIVDLLEFKTSTGYASLVTAKDLRSIKKGKQYTISVYLKADAATKAYWNGLSNVLFYTEFDVTPGLNRYIYRFTATNDGLCDADALHVLNKYPTGDGIAIEATNAQIEEGAAATEYEPYKVQTITIPTPNGFHSSPLGTTIPDVIKASEVLMDGVRWDEETLKYYISDTVDFTRGVYIQRIGTKVFDGSNDEIWYAEHPLTNTTMFRIGIPDSADVGNVVGNDFLSSHFKAASIYVADIEGAQHTIRTFYFRIAKSALNTADVDGFKRFLAASPMTVNYALDTPIETPLTAEEIAAFKALHTNKPNTTVFNDCGANMAVKYSADTKTYIDNKFAELAAAIVNNA